MKPPQSLSYVITGNILTLYSLEATTLQWSIDKITLIFQSDRAQHHSSARVRGSADGETVLSIGCRTSAKSSPGHEEPGIMSEDGEVPCEIVSACYNLSCN